MINIDPFYPMPYEIPEEDHEFSPQGKVLSFKCPLCRGKVEIDQPHVCATVQRRPQDLYFNCENCETLLEKRNVQHKCTVQAKTMTTEDVLEIYQALREVKKHYV